jgi:hypothetical protein
MLTVDNNIRNEFIQSRLPSAMLPENIIAPKIQLNGTVGAFIPRSFKGRNQLNTSSPIRRGSISPTLSPKGSFSLHIDTDTHVGGVLTFYGRVKHVTKELYPGNEFEMVG